MQFEVDPSRTFKRGDAKHPASQGRTYQVRDVEPPAGRGATYWRREVEPPASQGGTYQGHEVVVKEETLSYPEETFKSNCSVHMK